MIIIMAKYTVICEICKTDFTVQLVGPTRDRDWKLSNWIWICDNCKDKAHQEENEKASAVNEASGLPVLSGSEKQIAWAETIRASKIEQINKFLSDSYNLDCLKKRADRRKIVDADKKIDMAIISIKSKTSASWWIDSRDFSAESFIVEELNVVNLPEEQAKIEAQKATEADVKAEATVRPEHPVTETVAEITCTQDTVKISFPEKNDTFRELVKTKLCYSWDSPCWIRKISMTDGDMQDRAAETGHKLLANGFCIRIIDRGLRQKAISGEYVPECKKWITSLVSYPEKLVIWWKKEAGDYYTRAKRIPGARWISPSMKVPVEQYEEVLGFAEVHGFKVSAGAQKLIEQAKKAREESLTVNIKPVPESKLFDTGNPPILEVPEGVMVDDEFKD